jgi:iron complex transport system ATP-binding protein
MSALQLQDVSVTLDGAEIVTRISIDAAPGDWVALIGPNGAGKSTTLRAIAGLVPYRGQIEIAGADTRTLRRRELARRVAYLPQVPNLPPQATVHEYVLLGRTPHLAYLASEGRHDHEAVGAALTRLDLLPFAQRRLGSLSGGERQRATLARALAQEASVLLLDEPTSALDVGRQQQALEIVDELRGDGALTVVTAMHDLTLAGQYADRLVLLDRGRVVAGGAATDVLTRALISEHYGADVRVVGEPETGLVVVPVRRRA